MVSNCWTQNLSCLGETTEVLPRSHSRFYFQMGRDVVCSRLSLKQTWVYSAEEPEWKAKQRAEIRTSPTEIRPSSTLTTNQKHSLKICKVFPHLLMIKIWKGILMWRLTKGQIQRKGVTLFKSLKKSSQNSFSRPGGTANSFLFSVQMIRY